MIKASPKKLRRVAEPKRLRRSTGTSRWMARRRSRAVIVARTAQMTAAMR